jgi:hypothetical protein
MLRYAYALAARIAALTTLTALLVHGQPHPDASNPSTPQISSEQPFDATTPICYIRLENGQLRDLRHLCGKKLTSPTPLRNVQRLSVPPDDDADADDESAPRVRLRPQSTASPAATTSPSPTSLPVASPPSPALGRPTNVQPSPTNPPTIAPSEPHPLAIPQDRD